MPDSFDFAIPLKDSSQVTRLHPAGGPIQTGDVWQDARGTQWVAIGPPNRIRMHKLTTNQNDQDSAELAFVHNAYNLVKLIFRLPEETDAE
jgi:hypothetical protein